MQKQLIIFFTILTIYSCKKDSETLQINQCGVAFEASLKYVAIGDEFNTGLFLQDDDVWPTDVQEYLSENGYAETEITIIGEENLTTEDLSSFIQGNPDTDCKNLSTVMVGVHDLLAGLSTADFKSDYSALVDDVIGYTGSALRVTCIGLPDFSQVPGLPSSAGTAQEVKSKILSYNGAIAEVSAEKGVGFADIFPISEPSYPLMLTDDDFHPNADQHQLWATVVSGVVEEGLD